jgi:hypothetical protein
VLRPLVLRPLVLRPLRACNADAPQGMIDVELSEYEATFMSL